MNQDRRDFLISVGSIVGFSALIIAMPVIPMKKIYRKFFGGKADPVTEPAPLPQKYLWQTEEFKERQIQVRAHGFTAKEIQEAGKSSLDYYLNQKPYRTVNIKRYSNNEVPAPEGLGGLLEADDGKWLRVMSDKQLATMSKKFQKRLINHPRSLHAGDSYWWWIKLI